MKQSDYAPRASGFDHYLTGSDLIGAEVGADVGAHAHALLQFCAVKKLYVIDLWEREYYRGYCEGRLNSAGFKNRVEYMQMKSEDAAKKFETGCLDFAYIDITHDYDTVYKSLNYWWPKVKSGGLIGYRNYRESNTGLFRAVNQFLLDVAPYLGGKEFDNYHGDLILFKK